MTPLSYITIVIICVLGTITLALQAPIFLLGILLSPLTSRANWFVEFLYPSAIARWGHLTILRMGAKNRNGVSLDENSGTLPMHSRSIEQRVEVVKGRVYIHPLPQLLDNIGYLIVCVPPRIRRSRNSDQGPPPPIIGILVDCGDAESVIDQIELIRDVHYANNRNNNIEIHALLCTHKHHDHTAGNKTLLNDEVIGATLKDVYGGAIERVPFCTKPVTDGDFVELPTTGGNNMGELIEIECIALPSHTRGSIVFALRNKADYGTELGSSDRAVISLLFTGDALFSGGGGVPFESDFESAKDKATDEKTVHSRFKPNGGSLSIERCFAELLRRGVKDEDAVNSPDGLAMQQMMVFPGHEYTMELLQRQMQPSNMHLNSQWNKHQPSVFFDLASQYFIAGHRRDLPKSTRLLTVPSSMKRELKINPYFRSLRKRGEFLLTALTLWYKHVHDEKKNKYNKFTGSDADMAYLSMPFTFSIDESIRPSMSGASERTPSSTNTWNVNHDDFNRSVFTTFYTSDLDEVIRGLKNGKINPSTAATKLAKLSEKLEEPAVIRRPIPGTLPSEKKMYMGLLALAVLGSAPSGLSASDSEIMKMPAPVVDTDRLLISKKRLISSLYRLGLLPCDGGSEGGIDQIVLIINLLWDEACIDRHDLQLREDREAADFELGQGEAKDYIELGALKLTLFAVAYNQPSWFKKYCMPCKSTPPTVSTSKMKRSGGELVKHDVTKCPLCANVLGCPKHDQEEEEEEDDDVSYDASLTNEPVSPSPNQGQIRLVEGTPKKGDDDDIELRMVRGVSSRRKIALAVRAP